jgi:uncharacterized protein
MRKSALLAPLFTRTTQGVLATTVLRPEREWYLSDLASHLDVRPSSLQRTLGKLSRAGILIRREDGNRVYYRPNLKCPILEELAGIFVKTIGIADPIRAALAPLAKQVRVAFIHGSIAENRERSDSDVDIIIVGEVPGPELAFVLRPLEDRLGREINVTRYTPQEFAIKVAEGNHFVSAVLRKKRVFLIGGEHELDQAAGGETGGTRADKQKGAR